MSILEPTKLQQWDSRYQVLMDIRGEQGRTTSSKVLPDLNVGLSKRILSVQR